MGQHYVCSGAGVGHLHGEAVVGDDICTFRPGASGIEEVGRDAGHGVQRVVAGGGQYLRLLVCLPAGSRDGLLVVLAAAGDGLPVPGVGPLEDRIFDTFKLGLRYPAKGKYQHLKRSSRHYLGSSLRHQVVSGWHRCPADFRCS